MLFYASAVLCYLFSSVIKPPGIFPKQVTDLKKLKIWDQLVLFLYRFLYFPHLSYKCATFVFDPLLISFLYVHMVIMTLSNLATKLISACFWTISCLSTTILLSLLLPISFFLEMLYGEINLLAFFHESSYYKLLKIPLFVQLSCFFCIKAFLLELKQCLLMNAFFIVYLYLFKN